MNYAINDSSPYRPHPSKAKVIEDSARTANQSYSYTGTVRTVGSGKTYATLTAAYSAAASGDIIEVYGTINLNSEAGGYWLINTAKSVLVRGSTSNASDTVLDLSAAASFCVRVRINSGIVFKNLTITTNQNAPTVYIDTDEANRNIVFDNCRIINTGTGAASRPLTCSGAYDTKVNYIEFKNCYFDKKNSTAIPFSWAGCGANTTVLITGSEFRVEQSQAFIANDAFRGSIIMYDNNIIQNNSQVAVQFGTDTAIPAATIPSIDFRGNIITFLGAYVSHGVLFGRGTSTVKCYNNEVYMPSTNDSLAIGYVIKTTSTNVGDSLIKGNFAYAPRPLYIKGGSKTTISKNIFVSNYDNGSNWECFGFTNHKNGADEVLSRSNVITYNTFIATHYGIHVYNTGAAESDDVSLKTCTLNNNKFYFNSDKYLYNFVSSTGYTWSNRYSFWASENDLNSIKINSAYIPNFM